MQKCEHICVFLLVLCSVGLCVYFILLSYFHEGLSWPGGLTFHCFIGNDI